MPKALARGPRSTIQVAVSLKTRLADLQALLAATVDRHVTQEEALADAIDARLRQLEGAGR